MTTFENRIFYFCPDMRASSAGVRRLYRHVYLLNHAGFNATILHLQDHFELSDMPKVPVSYLNKESFYPHDIIVIPEGCPTVMDALKDIAARRFAIALNWDYVFKDLPLGKNWKSFNIERVLTVSPVIARMISWSMGLPTHVLKSSIDQQLYYVDANAKRPLIVFIKRKAAKIDELKRLLTARNPNYTKAIEWLGLHGLSQEIYAERIREAALFLSLSEAEGFPTSCLEAMACGTLVAGYDSVGGRNQLHDSGDQQNCFIAPIGDYVSLAYMIEPVLESLLEGKWAKWNTVMSNALATVHDLTNEHETRSLISFWTEICSKKICPLPCKG